MSRSNLEYGAIIDADDENDGDLGQTDLEFHGTFSHEKSALTLVDFTAQEDLGKPQRGSFPTGGTNPAPAGKRMLWSIEYYAQFCDVDTKQVLDRCWAAIFPRTPFLDVLGGNPDLYGPFWITSTTILILYFSSTLAGYLAAFHSGTRYNYDFTLLTAAAGLMYGYAAVIPTILWGAMKWYGCEPSLLEILCLYGYGGMLVWIPVSLLVAIIQIFSLSMIISVMQWVSVSVGFAWSCLFLVRNLYPVLSRADAQTSRFLLIGIVACHAGLAIAVKFVFFGLPKTLAGQ